MSLVHCDQPHPPHPLSYTHTHTHTHTNSTHIQSLVHHTPKHIPVFLKFDTQFILAFLKSKLFSPSLFVRELLNCDFVEIRQAESKGYVFSQLGVGVTREHLYVGHGRSSL